MAKGAVIWFVRHGESELNRNRTRIGGRSSWCELNELGREQAQALGEHLAPEADRFDRFISSTAVRAQQTARIALDAMGVPLYRLELDHELQEIHMGEWEGRERLAIYNEQTLAAFAQDAWNYRPPGGETQAEAAARTLARLDAIAGASREGARVMVIAHGLLVRAVLTELEGLDRNKVYEVPIANTSITRLARSESGWRVVSRNDTAHLAARGIGGLDGVVRPRDTNPTR